MAALEGFEPTLNAGDLEVGEGSIDGIAVAGATLDAAALADGVAYAVTTEAGGALAVIEAANLTGTQVVVASCTVATGAATLESLADRGKKAAEVVSANF